VTKEVRKAMKENKLRAFLWCMQGSAIATEEEEKKKHKRKAFVVSKRVSDGTWVAGTGIMVPKN